MKLLRRFLACVLCAAAALASAQETRRIVVGFPPGGTLDVLGRAVAQAAQEESGITFVVDNQPGAGSLLAAQNVARAQPDGRTLLLAPVVVPAFMPHLYRKMTFDPMSDLVPVAELGSFNFALAVGAQLPVKTLAEWVAYVKAHPGKTSFGSFGAGTPSHFVGVMFNRAAGTDTLHVPYKGGAPAMLGFMAGEVQSMFMTGLDGLTHARAGKLKVIGIAAPRATELAPGVPLVSDTVPGFSGVVWFGLLAPAGTPADVIGRLNDAIARAVQRPAVKKAFADMSTEAVSNTPAEFAQVISSELAQWTRLVRESGAKFE